jgi:hypothetical protein
MKIRHLTLLVVLFFCLQHTVHACFCSRPDAKDALRYADIVFRGELIEHRGRIALFRVDEQWKGNLAKEVEVEWREGNHGDCDGFWPQFLKVGSHLLVFATRGTPGIYHTSICLPTKFVDKAGAEIKELGPGNPPRGAENQKNEKH